MRAAGQASAECLPSALGRPSGIPPRRQAPQGQCRGRSCPRHLPPCWRTPGWLLTEGRWALEASRRQGGVRRPLRTTVPTHSHPLLWTGQVGLQPDAPASLGLTLPTPLASVQPPLLVQGAWSHYKGPERYARGKPREGGWGGMWLHIHRRGESQGLLRRQVRSGWEQPECDSGQ